MLLLDVAALVDDARALEERSPAAARRFFLAAAGLERRRLREGREAGIAADDEDGPEALVAIRAALRRCHSRK